MIERRSDVAAPLAIVCAGGTIPFAVADSLKAQGRPFVLFALRGIADEARVTGYPHHWVGLGQIGRLERLARAEGCHDIAFIGTLKRPSVWTIRFDWVALARLPRIIAAFRGGDNHLLTGIGRIFEADGFRMIGVHEVVPQVLMPDGVLTTRVPSQRDHTDIAHALAALNAVGRFDVGQAAVVADGQVLALEGIEGTDGMLAQLAELRTLGRVRTGVGIGVLVKAPKPMQDHRYDLPAVGPHTIALVTRAGLAGIAVVAGGGVIAELDRMIEAANRENVFIIGIKGAP